MQRGHAGRPGSFTFPQLSRATCLDTSARQSRRVAERNPTLWATAAGGRRASSRAGRPPLNGTRRASGLSRIATPASHDRVMTNAMPDLAVQREALLDHGLDAAGLAQWTRDLVVATTLTAGLQAECKSGPRPSNGRSKRALPGVQSYWSMSISTLSGKRPSTSSNSGRRTSGVTSPAVRRCSSYVPGSARSESRKSTQST